MFPQCTCSSYQCVFQNITTFVWLLGNVTTTGRCTTEPQHAWLEQVQGRDRLATQREEGGRIGDGMKPCSRTSLGIQTRWVVETEDSRQWKRHKTYFFDASNHSAHAARLHDSTPHTIGLFPLDLEQIQHHQALWSAKLPRNGREFAGQPWAYQEASAAKMASYATIIPLPVKDVPRNAESPKTPRQWVILRAPIRSLPSPWGPASSARHPELSAAWLLGRRPWGDCCRWRPPP